MKKTIISLVAAPLLLASAAAAADKAADNGVAFKVGGQAVLYYNTIDAFGNKDLFDHAGNSKASAGLKMHAAADLGAGFATYGEVNVLSSLGLEKNVVGDMMQWGKAGKTNSAYVSQLYVTKTMGKTTLKMGRQELPKSLSPFAFSEGWNVYKNTFDAAVLVNSDIPLTTLVGAWVSGGNFNAPGAAMGEFGDLHAAGAGVSGGAYMLTAAVKIPYFPITGSYYHLSQMGGSAGAPGGGASLGSADAFWLNGKLDLGKDAPLGLCVAVQGGMVTPDLTVPTDDTTAFGGKVGIKIGLAKIIGAVTVVDDGTAPIQNTGGVKTPLFTQMVLNQTAIKLDNTTGMLKGVFGFGDAGKLIAMGSYSDIGDKNGAGYAAYGDNLMDLELLYKIKAGGINWLAAYVFQDADKQDSSNNLIRFVARYNF